MLWSSWLHQESFELSLAFDLISRHVIVDDVLAAFPDHRSLKEAMSQIQSLFGSMALATHKWAANYPLALAEIRLEDRAKCLSIEIKEWQSDQL